MNQDTIQTIQAKLAARAENGTPIIKIGRKGTKTFQFGDDGKPFTIDVVAVHNLYLDYCRPLQNDKGMIPPERIGEQTKIILELCRDLSGTQDLNLSECLEFVAVLGEEVEKLRSFFDADLRKKRSSQESSGT